VKIASFLVWAMIACGGGSKAKPLARTEVPKSDAEGKPCSQEVALSCPDGQVDACAKLAAKDEPDKPDDGEDESGGTGTAMALDEGKMGAMDATHKCVPK